MEQAGRIPPMMELAPLARAFTRAENPLYFVGGSVRNALLGLPYDDLDVTGAASSQQAVDLARSAGGKASIRDTEMGTVDIAVGELALEYTPFRRESYGPGGGHRPQQVIFTHRMEEDALRRDFTVNALYADVLTGEVADPLGGLADLNARRLRSCRAPMETLGDDGARILRMVRFACQLGFSVDPALYGVAKAMVGNLGDVAMERKRDELLKILLSDVRYPGLEKEFAAPGHLRGLLMLEDLGAFYDLLPQLMEGRGMEQPGRYHRYGVLQHNLMVCAATPPVPALRLAGLLHDVAKPRCFYLTGGKMHGHDLAGEALCRRMLARLRLDNRTVDHVALLVGRHMFDLDGSARESTCRKRFAGWGFDFVRELILLREADVVGSGMGGSLYTAKKWREILAAMEAEGAVDSMAGLAITGREIMEAAGIPPGPAVGRIQALLFDRVAVNPRLNRREVLIREAKGIYKGLS